MSDHVLPALRYAYDGLEPYISLEALSLHHQKHHQVYVQNLNAAEKEYDQNPTDEQRQVLEAVMLFNRGAHENHTLFWQNLAPPSSAHKGHGGVMPDGALRHFLQDSFESMEAMKHEFRRKSARIQGAGWCWLALNLLRKRLEVVTTENEATLSQKYAPIIAVDVWEHAYYLQYKNAKVKYIDAIWNIIDFYEAEKRLTYALDNIDASVTGAELTNTGTVALHIIDGPDTFEVGPEASHTVTTASTNTLVQATGKTIATITYKDNSTCTVARGVQVTGAKFDLKISMRA